MLKQLKLEIKKHANPEKAKLLQKFFKTGKGEYGEGDVFLGIVVPKQRALVKKYWRGLNLDDIDKLLKSKYHEHRLIALLVLIKKYQHPMPSSGEPPLASRDTRGSRIMDSRRSLPRALTRGGNDKKRLYNFYISHTRHINNWDLVDLSAPNIIGSFLYSLSLEGEGRVRGKNDILIKLVKSNNLWERRISVLSTFAFIKKGDSRDTLKLAKILLSDKHDLIHKAVGWALREVGKRCGKQILIQFLNKYAKQMPRTMLRYSIERLPERLRKHYLEKKYDRKI